ncbi:MAG TPA: hypothetical protein VFN41_02350 [Candidatus Limnocylindrales bacterium]|nr:hypothetical protein [Candidatus Limnocylindrales bacterium]
MATEGAARWQLREFLVAAAIGAIGDRFCSASWCSSGVESDALITPVGSVRLAAHSPVKGIGHATYG